MVKTKMFAFLFAAWSVVFGSTTTFTSNREAKAQDYQVPKRQFNLVAPVQENPKSPIELELIDVQVPIAKENRKFNVSGVQCVWCSLENLARHNGESKLYDLTEKYKHATGPSYVAQVLNSRGVKYKQVYSGKKAGIDFIREYVTKKKMGVGVGLQGVHMINVVHFDEVNGIVKVIDNSGPNAMKIQTWTIEKFDQRFDGWAITILPADYRETIFDKRWGRKVMDEHPMDKIILTYCEKTN